MSGEQDTILQLEKQRIEAMMAKNADLLGKLFDDGLVYIHSSGRVDNKTSYLEALMGGKYNYHAFTCTNVKVRLYGDCAIVSGDAMIQVSKRLDVRFTNVWSRASGQWRNVHWIAVNQPQPA